MPKNKIPSHLKDKGVTQSLWDSCIKEDPMGAQYYAASPFQSGYTGNAVIAEEAIKLFQDDTKHPQAKSSDINWRALQSQAETKFKTSGPLLRTISLKADLTSGSGFTVYSHNKEINEYVRLIFKHHKNNLYERVIGWLSRIQTTELFVLIAFSDDGFPIIRTLEPDKIGSGNDKGMITDPDDASTTMFYKHYIAGDYELIPDAWCVLDPEGFKEATSRLKDNDDYDTTKIQAITKSKQSKWGGYRRFVMHWKNLTGICEYLRDTSAVTTALEWLNLYENSQKWKLDNQKALSAYAYVFSWEDSPLGKLGALMWENTSEEDKQKSGILSAYTPGSKIFLAPGMKMLLLNPTLPSLSGSNTDIITLAGSGVGIPNDVFSGSTGDASYASIKSTRPIFAVEIDNLQYKFMLFIIRLMRVLFTAKIAIGGSYVTLGGEKFKLLPAYDLEWDVELDENHQPTGTIDNIKVEPVELVRFSFPDVKITDRPSDLANSLLGSKHAGLYGIGLSSDSVAKHFGIDDIDREKKKQLIEQVKYGKPLTGGEAEQIIEKKETESGGDDAK